MEKIYTGGPAFPNSTVMGDYVEGMTLRDYFAIHAPEGEVRIIYMAHNVPGETYHTARYHYADAMLGARGH